MTLKKIGKIGGASRWRVCYQRGLPRLVINENRAKVEEFKKKTSLDIVKTNENAFLDINIEEIVRAAEEALEEETGADIFGSDDLEDSEDDYDKLSEESEDD